METSLSYSEKYIRLFIIDAISCVKSINDRVYIQNTMQLTKNEIIDAAFYIDKFVFDKI